MLHTCFEQLNLSHLEAISPHVEKSQPCSGAGLNSTQGGANLTVDEGLEQGWSGVGAGLKIFKCENMSSVTRPYVVLPTKVTLTSLPINNSHLVSQETCLFSDACMCSKNYKLNRNALDPHLQYVA